MDSDLTYNSDDSRCFFRTQKAGDYSIGLVQCFDKDGEIHQKIGVADGFEPDVINEIMRTGANYDELNIDDSMMNYISYETGISSDKCPQCQGNMTRQSESMYGCCSSCYNSIQSDTSGCDDNE